MSWVALTAARAAVRALDQRLDSLARALKNASTQAEADAYRAKCRATAEEMSAAVAEMSALECAQTGL